MNLVLLCRKHHRKVHKPGWCTKWELRDGKRILVVVTPDGSVVEPPAPPGGPPPEPPPPGRRRTGTGERLTPWARDCFYDTWTRADQRGLDEANDEHATAAEAATEAAAAAEAEAVAAAGPADDGSRADVLADAVPAAATTAAGRPLDAGDVTTAA